MTAPTIPAFLIKLVNLLEEQDINDIIAWDHTGSSFHIFDQSRLAKEVLPLYFKHNNIASFIRQLNMYGFRKVIQIEHSGSMKIEQDDLQFSHPYFIKGHEHLLENIKRKTSGVGTNNTVKVDEPKLSKDDVQKVLSNVNALKSKQDNMNDRIGNLKRENEALWREVATMRQKHSKQQQVVNKLISFLVTVVGSRGMSATMKRKMMPLMLENTPTGQGPSRAAKAPRQYASAYNVELPETPNSGRTGRGITIREVSNGEEINSPDQPKVYTFDSPDTTQTLLTADLLEDPVVIANARENIAQSMSDIAGESDNLNYPYSSSPVFPGSSSSQPSSQVPLVKETKKEGVRTRRGSKLKLNIPDDTSGIDVSAPSPTTFGEKALDQLTMAIPHKLGSQSFTPEILDNQLDNVQFNLDSIKDLLSDGYNLDANTLLGIFTEQSMGSISVPRINESLFDPAAPVQSLPPELLCNDNSNDGTYQSGDIVGNEMIQYNSPSNDDLSTLFDLGDIASIDPSEENLNLSFNDNNLENELNTPLVKLDTEIKNQNNKTENGANRSTISTNKLMSRMEDVD